jgi:type IV secretory pathway TrbD component
MIRFDDTDYGEIDLMKGLLAGVAGGLLASFLMEQFQAAWSVASEAMRSSKKRAGRKPDPATVKAANVVSEKITGRKLARNYKAIAGEAMHYGMGASSAAVYGVLAEVVPIVTTGNGVGFGTGVWLLADEVAVPAAGLSKPPMEIPLATHLYALASHLIYGSITETVRRAVRRAL